MAISRAKGLNSSSPTAFELQFQPPIELTNYNLKVALRWAEGNQTRVLGDSSTVTYWSRREVGCVT